VQQGAELRRIHESLQHAQHIRTDGQQSCGAFQLSQTATAAAIVTTTTIVIAIAIAIAIVTAIAIGCVSFMRFFSSPIRHAATGLFLTGTGQKFKTSFLTLRGTIIYIL
jgi:hypothetical protein